MKPSVQKIITKLAKEQEKLELSLGRELDKLILEGKELSKKRTKLGKDAKDDANKIENLVKSFNKLTTANKGNLRKRLTQQFGQCNPVKFSR